MRALVGEGLLREGTQGSREDRILAPVKVGHRRQCVTGGRQRRARVEKPLLTTLASEGA